MSPINTASCTASRCRLWARRRAWKSKPINVPIGEAQGLLWAFDSLYVMVNTGGKYKSGLYRVRDTDGDDKLDSVETLRLLGRQCRARAACRGAYAPDGKSIYVVCGDKTRLTKFNSSRVPEVWDEDLMLPRVYGRGFMRDTPAPGGWIGKVDPDGKNWELIAVGFRNEYDAAFNLAGDLFTYDADMEWDMNTPWYRPTRICEVVSGAEFGWRNSSGKWPAYYPDSVPAVVDIGPGSPTGVTFGYGAKFPAKYQQAMFCCDWSYGKLYAVHLRTQRSLLQRHRGRICHRRAVAFDRCGHQPQRRGDVFCHRRPANHFRLVPRDLSRPRIHQSRHHVYLSRRRHQTGPRKTPGAGSHAPSALQAGDRQNLAVAFQ